MESRTIFYQAILDNFPGSIGLFDSLTTDLIWCNEKWTKQYPLFRSSHAKFSDILVFGIHPDDAAPFQKSFEQVAGSKESYTSILLRYMDHKPETNWLLCLMKRIKSENTERAMVCCFQTELTMLYASGRMSDFFHDYRRNYQWPAIKLLTSRERTILARIAHGHSYTRIAEQLFIQPETVNKHRKNIMKKLHLNSIALLACFAMENGLTEDDFLLLERGGHRV